MAYFASNTSPVFTGIPFAPARSPVVVQTTTVQDETWVDTNGVWLRKLVENERPGAWLMDLKRVDPTKPMDPNAPDYDPHATKPAK